MLATVIDISERKQMQERQELLTNELRHRTRNLLQVVHAILSRSLVLCPETEKKNVLARVSALSRAYSMLADTAFQGALLSEIIAREFALFSERVTVQGCDVVLSPAAAQNFALIVHELATNASKYGSLSMPAGHVVVEGVSECIGGHEHFRFRWTEFGGPAVMASSRRGFGSTILLDVARQFSLKVEMRSEPAGLVYELLARLSAISSATDNAPARTPSVA